MGRRNHRHAGGGGGSFGIPAVGGPEQLHDETIVLTWQEYRVQKADVGDLSRSSTGSVLSIYISSTGRLFTRLEGTSREGGTNTTGHGPEGDERHLARADINEGCWHYWPPRRRFIDGVASHGIGTARALQINEVAGAFAGLGMWLNGVLRAIALPLALKFFWGQGALVSLRADLASADGPWAEVIVHACDVWFWGVISVQAVGIDATAPSRTS